MSTETASQPHPNAANIPAPDLTQRPPRSVRQRLGGYSLLPRMLDKGRATLVGKNGEFHYDCPIDQHIINFLGFDPNALKEQLAAGLGDGEILTWIESNSKHPRTAWETEQWNNHMAARGPSDPDTRDFYNQRAREFGPQREDVSTWADLLDLDDYVTFGGKA